jgi:hypothetical protein
MKKTVVRPIEHKCPECNGTASQSWINRVAPASGFIRHGARNALAREELPTEAALAFHMLCMFGQLSPLLGDLKIGLLRTGIACSFRPSFGFFGSLPVFFRSFHADALRSLNEFRTPLTLS